MPLHELMFLGKALAVVIVIFVFFVLYRYQKRTMRRQSGALLKDGEKRIREIYCKTRDLAFHGLISVGSPYEGKLILSDQRLIYTTYDERKVAFTLIPSEVISIETAQVGRFEKLQALRIHYKKKEAKEDRTISFAIPSHVKLKSGLFESQRPNLDNINAFTKSLLSWKEGILDHEKPLYFSV